MDTLQLVKSKIYDWDNIQDKLNIWKSEGKKIVFTNGCFDILHLGHVTYLSKAKDLGDILIIGVNSDKSPYWLNKGPNRPINNEETRAIILGCLMFVDAILLFSDETPLELIKIIKPNILVKGGDYKVEDIAGYDFVKDRGGEIKTIQIIEGYSTTNIISKL